MATEESDQDLMRRVQRQDPEAFRLLYERYAPRLLGVIRRMISDPYESEDVLQNVFFYIWTRRELYRAERGSVEGFLFQITRSRLIDHWRRHHTGREVILETLPDSEDKTDQESRTAGNLYAAQLLAHLNVQERQAIELMVIFGFSQREIAEMTKTPLGTIKSFTRRGLEKLRRLLTEDKDGHATSQR